MSTINLKGTEDVLTIQLPGFTAVRIDVAARVVAVDGRRPGPWTTSPPGTRWSLWLSLTGWTMRPRGRRGSTATRTATPTR